MKSSPALPLLLSVAAPAAAAADRCTRPQFEAFLRDHDGAIINSVDAVAEGASYSNPSLLFPQPVTGLPALCAASVNVKSSANSSYNFGLFLPDSTWNKRFMTTGNSGFGGGINWPDMGIFSHYGFATMSTDTGHNSSMTESDWALNNPEGLEDFGHRAMHGSVKLAKELIAAYYAEAGAIEYSYYASCSTGGRQGLKEIQLDPTSFDGIAVGAPAWWTERLASYSLRSPLSNYPADAPGSVQPQQFAGILAEMVKQCDPQDGLEDGIVSDPFGCDFDFGALQCGAANATENCLSEAQRKIVQQLYSDWVDESAGNELVFPGLSLGANPGFNLGAGFTGLGLGYFQNWLYNDPNWDPTQFSLADVREADRTNPSHGTPNDFDMAAYRERGGKIIMYHGTADSLIPTKSSRLFHERVTTAMDGGADGQGLADFYRMFYIPGMDHCNSSPSNAPWYVAGGSQEIAGASHSVPGYEDADHDIILAMMQWVEGSKAPEKLIATKFINDTATDGVHSQRPVCPVPQMPRYLGEGDINLAESWECGV